MGKLGAVVPDSPPPSSRRHTAGVNSFGALTQLRGNPGSYYFGMGTLDRMDDRGKLRRPLLSAVFALTQQTNSDHLNTSPHQPLPPVRSRRWRRQRARAAARCGHRSVTVIWGFMPDTELSAGVPEGFTVLACGSWLRLLDFELRFSGFRRRVQHSLRPRHLCPRGLDVAARVGRGRRAVRRVAVS